MKKIDTKWFEQLFQKIAWDYGSVKSVSYHPVRKAFEEHLEGRWIVEPDELVEVWGYTDHDYPEGKNYLFDNLPKNAHSNDTLKAYLVGIEPIKQESAEDVCELIVDAFEQPGPMPERQLYEMAKRVLDRKRATDE